MRERSLRTHASLPPPFLDPGFEVSISSIPRSCCRYVHQTLFDKIWYLRCVEKHICVQVAMRMHSSVMAPGELASLRKMYVIERGLVLYQGRVLTSGKLWGVDDILLPAGLLKYERLERARSMTYVEYRELSRIDFQDVIEADPITYQQMRKYAIFVALKRYMINLAAKLKKSGFSSGTLLDQVNVAATAQAQKEYARIEAAETMAKKVVGTEETGPPGSAKQHTEEVKQLNTKLHTLTDTVEQLAVTMIGMQQQLATLLAQDPPTAVKTPSRSRSPGRKSSNSNKSKSTVDEARPASPTLSSEEKEEKSPRRRRSGRSRSSAPSAGTQEPGVALILGSELPPADSGVPPSPIAVRRQWREPRARTHVPVRSGPPRASHRIVTLSPRA